MGVIHSAPRSIPANPLGQDEFSAAQQESHTHLPARGPAGPSTASHGETGRHGTHSGAGAHAQARIHLTPKSTHALSPTER